MLQQDELDGVEFGSKSALETVAAELRCRVARPAKLPASVPDDTDAVPSTRPARVLVL